MPSIRVFDFANMVKDYIRDVLKHPSWFVHTILAIYSTRVKDIKYGYKVVPLEAGVIAYDSEAKSIKNCRIKFEALCDMFSTGSHSFPYILVRNTEKNTRKIFDEGFTYLSIDCRKENIYEGTRYYNHYTNQTNSNRIEQLNESILSIINERLNSYNKMTKKQFNESLNELLYDDDEPMQPEDYDYSDSVSISCDIGGYKD